MHQQLLKGRSIELITALIKEKSWKKILFVLGSQKFSLEFLMADVNISIIKVPAGLPTVSSLNELYLNEDFDCIVAIGGGRILDFAKGILFRTIEKKEKSFFIAVPTTAGSGSEATPFAVFYSGKEKISFDHPSLLPDVAILDAEMLQNLSSQQKAISGIDSICQCIEAIWNIHATKESTEFATNGLKILWKLLPEYIHSNNLKIAEEILEAAHLAGKAIAITRTTGAHALSYYLTAVYKVPHGAAVGVFLPVFFIYNERHAEEFGHHPGGVSAIKNSLKIIYEVIDAENAEQALVAFQNFLQRIVLAKNFKQLQLNNVDVDELLGYVNMERFKNNPVAYNFDALKILINKYLFDV